jgi:hypothetical protein
MSHRHPDRRPTNREEISRCQVTASERFNVSLRVYKTIKALVQLAGVGAGILAITQGADPMSALTIIGVIIAGPEYMEYKWANGSAKDE